MSGRDRYLFVFSPEALRAFYALPERDASKGLADYRMLVRKLPEELFAGVRTLAHDLFGAQDVETYLGHLDHALDLELAELGAEGTIDAFGFARRVGHRLGLACWIGDRAGRSRRGSSASSPSSTNSTAPTRSCTRRACAPSRPPTSRPSGRACALRDRGRRAPRRCIAAGDRAGFLDEIARRWSDTEEPERTQGIARDVVLLHIATMTNLFAALGWTLAQLALDPGVLARVAAGDDPRCSSGARSSRRASVSAP